MSNFLSTLVIAIILVLLALLGLGIGWLLTGKSRIVRGACGMDPKKRKGEGCGKNIRCDLCDRTVTPEKKEPDA